MRCVLVFESNDVLTVIRDTVEPEIKVRDKVFKFAKFSQTSYGTAIYHEDKKTECPSQT